MLPSFSVTKWIQLNWGDDGLRKFFANINACLRPGGYLLLEPQEFSSYKRRSRLTDATRANYKAIKLKPHYFSEYLALEFGFEEIKSDAVQAGQKGAVLQDIHRDLLLVQAFQDRSLCIENPLLHS
jgi:7SK snRNA methylphosphate capping enzyme